MAAYPAATVTEDGRFSTMNAQMLDLLACKDVKWQHQPLGLFLGQRLDAFSEDARTDAVSISEATDVDWFVKRPGGIQVPVTLNVFPMGDPGPRIHLVMIRNSPVELSKRQAIFEQRRELGRITRSLAVKALVADVAHKMNQPLTAVTLYATACRRQVAEGKQTQALNPMLEQLKEQTLRAGRVLERVQYNVRAPTEQAEAIDINRLVKSVVGLCAEESRIYGVDMVVELDSSTPSVPGVSQLLRALVHNLLSNGLQAMARVDCAYGSLLRVITRKSPRFVDLIIEDQGAGMAEEHKNYLMDGFEPDLESAYRVGLFVCRAIIEQHSGAILWQPNPAGRGSRVIARLPTIIERKG